MSTAKRLRRSPEGGYARGDETRTRIIEAAVDLFGEYGFDGASTRDIAARAGVNAPALQYYFENKEGVYHACIEAMTDLAWKSFGPAVEYAQKVLGENGDTEALIGAFLRIQEAMADGAFAKVNKPGRRLFFAREQAGYEPESATRIISTRIREPLNNASAALVARISGRPADDPITIIRTFSLHGQLIVFHVANRATMSLLGWKSIDAEKADLLKSTVRAQTRILLEHWNREREAALASGEAANEALKPKAAAVAEVAASGKSGSLK